MDFKKDILEKGEQRKNAILNSFSNSEDILKSKDTFKTREELEKAFDPAEHIVFDKDGIGKFFDELKKSNDTEVIEKGIDDFGKLKTKYLMVNGEPTVVFVGLKTDLVKAEEETEEEESKEEDAK